MLKKITLATLFMVSVAVGASSSVFAHSVKIPVPSTPQGFCYPGVPWCN